MTGRRTMGLIAVVLCCQPCVNAGFVNGGFEGASLGGWTTAGPVTAVTGEYARDFLGLTQPPAGETWLPWQGSYFASLWSTNSDGIDDASLSTTFAASAGEVLSFHYFFDFGDLAPDYDTAVGMLSWTGGSAILFEHNTPGHELGDDENIGWSLVSYALPVTGTYTLQFITQDGVGSFESILGIDGVAVGTVIPVPGAVVLGSIGIGVAGWLRRRRML